MKRAVILETLDALGDAEASEFVRARRETLAALDPLWRVSIRRDVAQRVYRVTSNTRHGDDESHLHRLALIDALGEHVEDADDVEAVREAFDSLRSELPPVGWRRRGPSKLLALLCLSALVVGGGYRWIVPAAYEGLEDDREESPLAFTRGGRPARGSQEMEAVLSGDLVRYARAISETRDEGPEPLDAEALAGRTAALRAGVVEQSREVFDPEVSAHLHALLDQSVAIASAPAYRGPAVDSFIRSVDALNLSFAERGLGYYVDAAVLRRRGSRPDVLFAPFSVRQVSIYRVDEAEIRALQLMPLGTGGFRRSVLGFTRPNIHDALVLLDRTEEWLVSHVFPAIAGRRPVVLFDEATRELEEPWVLEAEAAALTTLRETSAAFGVPEDELVHVGELLARRADRMEEIAALVEEHGITLRPSRRYELDLDPLFAVKRRLLAHQWRPLEHITEELGEPRPVEAFTAALSTMAESTERHEVQHRLDYQRGMLDEVPESLRGRYGSMRNVDGTTRRWTHLVVAELSAYLSQFARSGPLVRYHLVTLARYALDRRLRGKPEREAAFALIVGMTQQLEGAPLSLEPGSIRRPLLTDALLSLLERSDDELHAAAAGLWSEIFGLPLPAMERLSESRH